MRTLTIGTTPPRSGMAAFMAAVKRGFRRVQLRRKQRATLAQLERLDSRLQSDLGLNRTSLMPPGPGSGMRRFNRR